MKYSYLNGFPVHHLNHSTYYQINGFSIRKFENGVEAENWQQKPHDSEKHVFEWAQVFWKDLNSGPSYEIDADQWATHYYTFLDGHVFYWTDDRHENCYVLNSVQLPEKFLSDPTTKAEGKNWLKRLLDIK